MPPLTIADASVATEIRSCRLSCHGSGSAVSVRTSSGKPLLGMNRATKSTIWRENPRYYRIYLPCLAEGTAREKEINTSSHRALSGFRSYISDLMYFRLHF